jgi:hypothetical protein
VTITLANLAMFRSANRCPSPRRKWTGRNQENQPLLDTSNILPQNEPGCKTSDWRDCPFKIGVLAPLGFFYYFRRDLPNFLQDGMVTAWSEPVPGDSPHTMTEFLLYKAYLDLRGRSGRISLCFDFRHFHVQVDGLAFRVLDFRKPRKWALFGSNDRTNWTKLYKHSSILEPASNSYVKAKFARSGDWKCLMLKFYRRDLLVEKLDFFGSLRRE